MGKSIVAEVPGELVRTKLTIGQELMRVAFGNEQTQAMKQKFADLFDEMTQKAMDADARANKGPMIHGDDGIRAHMVVVAAANETMRCMSEACKYLELACLYAVKGVTV